MGNSSGLSGEQLALARMKANLEDMMANPETLYENLITQLDAFRIRLQPSYVENGRVRPNMTKLPNEPLLTVTFGDAEMTYIQFVIMQGNHDLLKQILQKPDGRQQFLASRD